MNIYAVPMQGGYTFRTRNFDGTFNLFYISVEVIGETAKSYLIRLLAPIVGHPVRTTMTVRKHNVKIHSHAQRGQHDCSDAWWND